MLHDTNIDTSPRSVRIFALLLIAFSGFIGWLVTVDAERFLPLSVFLAVAWAIGIIPERKNVAAWCGVLIPIVLAAIPLAIRQGVDAMHIAIALWVIGGAAAVVSLASLSAGAAVMVGWTRAAAPIGWTISTIVMSIVYYLVLTPIGLIMRLAGKDPMTRKLDRNADTYWIEREGEIPSARYFKQF